MKTRTRDGAATLDGAHGSSGDEELFTRESLPQGATAADWFEQQPDWLALARDSFTASTRFLESSLRKQWEHAERAFHNEHPSNSKYNNAINRYRSGLYRPKTRTSIRQAEANAALALFATQDVVQVTASSSKRPESLASAEINQQLLQHRLTSPDPRIGIPWFQTAIAAYQDAQKYGVVVSKQSWLYDERLRDVQEPEIDPSTGAPLIDPMTGQPVMQKVERWVPYADRPDIELIPPENLRIDPGASWIDPINDSPYLIHLRAAPLEKVMLNIVRSREGHGKYGGVKWRRDVDKDVLLQSATRRSWDSTRHTRERDREDPKDTETSVTEHTTVWLHENIIRAGGRDWVFYTAGIHGLLSDPVPMEHVYLHCADGVRPYVMGYSLLETHRIYPQGKPALLSGLQQEANELVNGRLDNIKHAINRRWFVRRGAQVDTSSITLNAPSSVTMVQNPNEDVKEFAARDVTAGAFQEQERINADFDDLAGGMSPGSVATSRRLNETVGGMQMLQARGDTVMQLDLRTWSETWCEPVLRMVVKLEQIYESDIVLIEAAAENAQVYQRYNINTVDDQLLKQDLTTRVNVGLGAMDPMQRLEKFKVGMQTLVELFGPTLVSSLKHDQIIKEVIGLVGYRDGERFFNLEGPPPAVAALMQELEELEKKLETKIIDATTRQEVARITAIGRAMQAYIENLGDLDAETQKARNVMLKDLMQQDHEKRLAALSGSLGMQKTAMTEQGRQNQAQIAAQSRQTGQPNG